LTEGGGIVEVLADLSDHVCGPIGGFAQLLDLAGQGLYLARESLSGRPQRGIVVTEQRDPAEYDERDPTEPSRRRAG
jgi:hypothetical protein